MTTIEIVATGVAVLLGLALFSWVDRDQPEDLEDTEEQKAKRYLASRDDGNGD